ncbi:ZP domain-containing protein [Caerostris darwini]|uniref:ZP domain-containing protein n=1 Tax=Caerostris darwini TaxID=1538125 RepID=A0AAV4MNH2_9ARAC|nr:ZP domain-containing protein [Caerostris darwini]
MKNRDCLSFALCPITVSTTDYCSVLFAKLLMLSFEPGNDSSSVNHDLRTGISGEALGSPSREYQYCTIINQHVQATVFLEHQHHLHDNLVEERGTKSHVSRLDVVCSKDHMTVHMFFDTPFYGVVFSHSSPHHQRCVHVGPRAGVTDFSFDIRYDSCGTVEDLSGQFHENTIVIQYGEDILEAWDEAKRLRCEWLESFDKQSSKPTLAISDIEIVELNFQGDDIDCWMEVQEGKGPWARQVGGLVPIGSPLTLVIAINDNSREFDMRVKQCTASDGTGSEIQLTDQSGCILRPSLLTPFAKIRDFGGKATSSPILTSTHSNFQTISMQNLHTLESKKHQKLVELTKSNPSTIHQVAASTTARKVAAPPPAHKITPPSSAHQVAPPSLAQHVAPPSLAHKVAPPSLALKAAPSSPKDPQKPQRPQYLTQIPAHILQKSKSELGTLKKETNLSKEFKSEIQSSATNVHIIPEETKTHVHHGHHVHSEVEPVPIGHYHKIIGHDAHWNSEEVKIQDEQYFRHHIPPVKGPSLGEPKPEPAAWSADEVRSLTKEEVIHHHSGSKLLDNHQHISLQNEHIRIPLSEHKVIHPYPGSKLLDNHQHVSLENEHIRIPLSEQEVIHPHPGSKLIDNHQHISIKNEHISNPLSEQEVIHPHPGSKLIDNHHISIKNEHIRIPLFEQKAIHPYPGSKLVDNHHYIPIREDHLKPPQVPQPEPAAWSADDVRVLKKEEVFHPHISDHHVVHFKKELDRLAVSKEIFDDHKHHSLSQEPKPEPAPWTFDEVGPMHNPGLFNKHIEQEKLQEPKPEPAPWTLDEVKPLTKEDLKVHSLNYKLKSHSHHSEALPVYKESVHPPSPVPVYIPKYTPAPSNMSMTGPMMMKMMMTMPTLLPFTYQTARWPQKSSARHLRTDKRNYPYPIPQFTHQQQMMMSVIADRRMDGDDGDLQYELHPRSHHNLSDSSTTEKDESLYQSHQTDITKPILIGETATSKDTVQQPPSESQETNTFGDSMDKSSHISSDSSEDQKSDSSGATRPPITGFVPPSLDIDLQNNPKATDRTAHNPRALNRRRRSSEPVFGVKQKFQAIALSDLAFEFNMTRDRTAIFKGRREEIIYGICMSPASMSAGIGFILILILCSLIASLALYEHSWRLKNKTSHLSLLTKTFNGRLESLYRVSRSHPNSSVQ